MKSLKVKVFTCQLYKISVLILFIFTLNNIARAQTYPVTKAEKGDGIYSLLKRHGLSPEKYMDDFIRINKTKLGRNNALYAGQTYKLPIAKPSETEHTVYDIFGEKYKNVVRTDNKLAGAVYYLVSGHGGPDPGAIGHFGNHMLCEDEYAYDVTLRLAHCLLEHGALVYMIIQDGNDGIRDDNFLTPDKDEKCYPDLDIPRSQLGRLRQRKDAINDLYIKNKGRFQRLVIIHVDSRSKGENIDVFFYHDKRSNTGKKLAMNLQQTFKEKYDYYQPNRGYHGSVSERNLYVLKYSYPAAVFTELGNINHRRDQQRFMIPSNRQALATWLSEGLIKDFNNNK